MNPNIDAKITINLGRILEMKKGVPKDLLEKVGQEIGVGMGQRIRNDSTTVDGENLDENSGTLWYNSWKYRKVGHLMPLVLFGSMTDSRAWNVDVNTKTGKVKLKLDSSHQEKWDNIVAIAERSGKNWNRAWGVGQKELERLRDALIIWVKKLGVKLK